MIPSPFADAAHSVHPNYADRHDPQTRPIIERGSLLKINSKQRNATYAKGAALWARIIPTPRRGWLAGDLIPGSPLHANLGHFLGFLILLGWSRFHTKSETAEQGFEDKTWLRVSWCARG